MSQRAPILPGLSAALGLSAHRDPTRILVALLLPIGDTLFCQPALAGLRRRFPHARITALTYRHLGPLLATSPDLDDVLTFDDDPAHDFITRTQTTLEAIRERRFDLLVSFSPGGNCVAILSGIPRQVWQRLPFAFWLWGSALDQGYRARHAVDHYWNVVKSLGIMPGDPVDLIPRWQVCPADEQAACAHARSLNSAFDAAAPFIIVHPGAAGYGGRKRWPAEEFGLLAARLIAEQGARILVLGGQEDAQAAQTIVQATGGKAISLAGNAPLRESVALIAQCQLYIGCDSGLTHFACALGKPTVALFGVASLAQFTPRPVRPDHLRLILPDPPLAPAGFFVGTESALFPPKHPHDDRMRRISVERVYAAARSLQQVEAGLGS